MDPIQYAKERADSAHERMNRIEESQDAIRHNQSNHEAVCAERHGTINTKLFYLHLMSAATIGLLVSLFIYLITGNWPS